MLIAIMIFTILDWLTLFLILGELRILHEDLGEISSKLEK